MHRTLSLTTSYLAVTVEPHAWANQAQLIKHALGRHSSEWVVSPFAAATYDEAEVLLQTADVPIRALFFQNANQLPFSVVAAGADLLIRSMALQGLTPWIALAPDLAALAMRFTEAGHVVRKVFPGAFAGVLEQEHMARLMAAPL